MKRDLRALASTEHDVIVVGGGIYGACLAWEATQRGLKTALVEARDFGSGTSWNSLKTIHGGIRHLQRLDIPAFRQSLREKRALMRIAPSLVRALRAVAPIYGHGMKGREAFTAGLLIGSTLGSRGNKMLSTDAVRELIPGLPSAGLTGAATWTDAQVRSTERLLLAFLHAAAGHGAAVANDVPVMGILRDGSKVTGVRVVDRPGDHPIDVHGQVVVNAAGAGAPAVASLAGAKLDVPFLRAINLVFSRPPAYDFAVACADAGRYLFLVPWEGRTAVGTAYAPPQTTRDTLVKDLMASMQRAFPWLDLRTDEIALVHEGLVPGEGGAEGLWSRPRLVDHAREGGPSHLVSVVGVKYTTARAVAEDVVELLASAYALPTRRSETAATPLSIVEPAGATLEERVRFAIDEEMARTVDDVVRRRLDLGTRGEASAEDLKRVEAVVQTPSPRRV